MSEQPGTDRLRILVDAGIALSSELSLDALLQRIVETAAELTGARYAALGVIDQSGTGARALPHAPASTPRRTRRSATCRAAAGSSASSSARRARCGCTTSPTTRARSASRATTRR